MITHADRAKYALASPKPKALTLEERANEVVDIRDILRGMGHWAPWGEFYSYKIDCPWNYEHADGGFDKNCRLFGSTNIYCWAQHGYITPVYLYARWKGIPRNKAAEELLEERGLMTKNWRESWNDLLSLREEAEHGKLGSKNDAITALHTTLETHAAYRENEFTPPVRTAWAVVLAALDKLWELPNTDIVALEEWFNRSLTKLINTATMVEESEDS